jgi:RimJ/RimL family protein N-acetyltransferase
MHELPVTHPNVIPLFTAGGPNDTMLFATLEGHYPGRALVDDPHVPSQCVLRTHYGTTFFGGQVTERFLADAVTALRTRGAVRLVVSEQDAVRHQFPVGYSRIINRLEFVAREQSQEHLEALARQRPSACRLVPMDRALLAHGLWREEILEACGSADSFLAHGLGLCLLCQNEIVSEAYAMFEGAGRVELGVVTRAAYRGRNYAAITCAPLIMRCEARGKPMYWSCHQTNTPSVQVARKLGFTGERAYRWIRYEST